jgi:hypothetical protein
MKMTKVKFGNVRKMEYPLTIQDETGEIIVYISVSDKAPKRIIKQLKKAIELGLNLKQG